MLLAILNCLVDKLGVFGLFRGSEDERRVRGRILRLVLVDSGKITGVADNGLFIQRRQFFFRQWVVRLAPDWGSLRCR